MNLDLFAYLIFASALTASVQDVITELNRGKASLQAFSAEYQEDLHVAQPARIRRGATAWGARDSSLKYVGSIDKNASDLYIEPYGTTDEPQGDEHYYNDGSKYFTSVS